MNEVKVVGSTNSNGEKGICAVFKFNEYEKLPDEIKQKLRDKMLAENKSIDGIKEGILIEQKLVGLKEVTDLINSKRLSLLGGSSYASAALHKCWEEIVFIINDDGVRVGKREHVAQDKLDLKVIQDASISMEVNLDKIQESF